MSKDTLRYNHYLIAQTLAQKVGEIVPNSELRLFDVKISETPNTTLLSILTKCLAETDQLDQCELVEIQKQGLALISTGWITNSDCFMSTERAKIIAALRRTFQLIPAKTRHLTSLLLCQKIAPWRNNYSTGINTQDVLLLRALSLYGGIPDRVLEVYCSSTPRSLKSRKHAVSELLRPINLAVRTNEGIAEIVRTRPDQIFTA